MNAGWLTPTEVGLGPPSSEALARTPQLCLPSLLLPGQMPDDNLLAGSSEAGETRGAGPQVLLEGGCALGLWPEPSCNPRVGPRTLSSQIS